MKWAILSFSVGVLALAAPIQASSVGELLTIIEDVGAPLAERSEAVRTLGRKARRNRSVCMELSRRAGSDPIGKEVLFLLEWGHPCEDKWGQGIAHALLAEQGLQRFVLWDWISCNYLGSNPDLASSVAALNDYHLVSQLGPRLQECGFGDQQEILQAGGAEPPLISYEDEATSLVLAQSDGFVESAVDGDYVFVRGTDRVRWPSTYNFYLRIPPDHPDVDGVLYIIGVESARCEFVGKMIDGFARIDGTEHKLSMNASFRGSSCAVPGDSASTVSVSADHVDLWPVSGLYEYIRIPTRAVELVPGLDGVPREGTDPD